MWTFTKAMLGVAAVASGLMSAASAQEYPTQDVEITVGQPAGGSLDVLARIVAQGLESNLDGTFIVVNRPGGGGNVAGEYVTQQDPDGYSLLVLGSSMSFREALGTTPFTFPDDFTSIARFGMMASTMAVPADNPANTVKEFVEWTKKQDGAANYSSAGVGSGAHIFSMDFTDKTGAPMTHIPYTGGPAAVNALVSGDVSMFLGPFSLVKGLVDAGEIKVLATATPKRLELLPDVPTMAESGFPDFEAEQYIGLWGPKEMDEALVEKINAAVNKHLESDEVQKRFADLNIRPAPESPQEFSEFLIEDVARWTEVVKSIRE